MIRHHPAITLARELLGKTLASDIGGERVSGIITETEAYCGIHDPASHAYQGRRHGLNLGVWSAPNSWYVYRSYGIHWCVNLTSEPAGEGAAVLLRALRPIDGIDVMRRRRKGAPDVRLTNGPGNLCQALGITSQLDGMPRTSRSILRICDGVERAEGQILAGPRVGLSRAVDWPLRYRLAVIDDL